MVGLPVAGLPAAQEPLRLAPYSSRTARPGTAAAAGPGQRVTAARARPSLRPGQRPAVPPGPGSRSRPAQRALVRRGRPGRRDDSGCQLEVTLTRLSRDFFLREKEEFKLFHGCTLRCSRFALLFCVIQRISCFEFESVQLDSMIQISVFQIF